MQQNALKLRMWSFFLRHTTGWHFAWKLNVVQLLLLWEAEGCSNYSSCILQQLSVLTTTILQICSLSSTTTPLLFSSPQLKVCLWHGQKHQVGKSKGILVSQKFSSRAFLWRRRPLCEASLLNFDQSANLRLLRLLLSARHCHSKCSNFLHQLHSRDSWGKGKCKQALLQGCWF